VGTGLNTINANYYAFVNFIIGIVRCIDPTTRQFFIIVPSSVSPEQLQQVNTLVRGSIPTPIPQSLSLTPGKRGVTSAPYTADYTPKPKQRRDTTQVVERVHEGYQNNGLDEPSDAPIEVYGPDTEIETNNSELEKSTEIDQSTSPITSRRKPAKIITPEGPKHIGDIGLQEEMQLLEQDWLKNSPTKLTTHKAQTTTNSSKSTPPTNKRKSDATENVQPQKAKKQKKKQKQKQKQNQKQQPLQHDEHEISKTNDNDENNEENDGEDAGRFVRNPIYQPNGANALLEELAQQERAWEAIEAHDEPEYEEHERTDGPQRKLHTPGRKNMFVRANVHDKRAAKRISPAGAQDIVGGKRFRRIPRR
jgi:hypothetical protein